MPRSVKIKELYDEYCEWMADIDNARTQLANAFRELNNIDDDTWNLLLDYSYAHQGDG